jgi:hypothetical protein
MAISPARVVMDGTTVMEQRQGIMGEMVAEAGVGLVVMVAEEAAAMVEEEVEVEEMEVVAAEDVKLAWEN